MVQTLQLKASFVSRLVKESKRKKRTSQKKLQNRWETKQNFQANEIKFMTGSESPVNTMLTSDYKVFRAFSYGKIK